MKLWQKIFLLTLALVIVVVNATSLALLTTNHRLAIELEQQSASFRHSSLINELQYATLYKQLTDYVSDLSDEETLAVALEVVERWDKETPAMSPTLFRDGLPKYPSKTSSFDAEYSLLFQPDYSSVIIEDEGKTYLLVVSSTILYENSYQLVTTTDISSTYALYRDGFDQVRFIGVISALVIAGLLQMLVRGLLNPLRELSDTTRMIAGGDLENRALVIGHDEVAEVARNFNTMADSIEHNVIELEKLAESRKVFIGNLAHEMKTPLTSILGYADILRVKRVVNDTDRIDYANVIVSETKRLQMLSGKLMELLTLGNLHIIPVKVEIHELFAELITILQPIMKSHKMELVVELPEEKAFVNVDRELIKSLIFNLVDNSIKASSPPAKIFLIVSIEDTQVIIKVIDGGVGIPENQIPMLTEPFYMLDKARTRKHGGAGLGLALCSEIAQVHGSKLLITSKLGEGTCVSIALQEVRDHG